jgi:hypothetical protein
LDSGYVSVSVDEAIEAGKKIPYRGDYGFFGTRYNPSTIGEITAGEIWSGAKSNLGLGITLAGTLGANVYDYGWGEHRDEGLMSREFVASTLVDFGIAGMTGLAAAGMAAGGIALLGASVPVAAAIAATAVLGLGIGALVDTLVDVEGIKEDFADGVDAWDGIADNAGVILDVAGKNAREQRAREIQEGVYPRHR